MSKTVQFTINLNGNAVSGVATLTDKVNELSRATGKAQGAFAGLGKIGGKLMVFNQAFELIGKVVSKSREFVEANNAKIWNVEEKRRFFWHLTLKMRY